MQRKPKGKKPVSYKPNKRPTKKVEVDVDRDDINKADLKGSSKLSRAEENDPSWYARNEQIMRDAASFSTGYPIGVALPQNMFNTMGLKSTIGYIQTPGIMAIEFMPTVGRSADAQSPINMAARAMYSFVRYANSGSAVGAPSDMMQYLVASDSIYMWHASLARVYGLLRDAQYTNQYKPVTMVEAMGFNYNDLVKNMAQFRYHINSLALRANRIAIPNDVAYVMRHVWMAGSVFLDSSASKAQMYAYVPTHFYTRIESWTVNDVAQPPKCELVAPYTYTGNTRNLLSLNDIIAFTDKLLNNILQSESFGITTGDIMKAYGRDKLFALAPIAEDFTVVPVYSQEVLSQIENLDLIPFVSPASFNIYQTKDPSSDNWLTSGVHVTGDFAIEAAGLSGITDIGNYLFSAAYIYMSQMRNTKLLNFHKDDVTPSDAMVASRLTLRMNANPYGSGAIGALSTTANKFSGFTIPLESWGSEIATQMRIFTYAQNGDGLNGSMLKLNYPLYGGSQTMAISTVSGVDSSWEQQAFLYQVNQFDWHPELYGYTSKIDVDLSASTNPGSSYTDPETGATVNVHGISQNDQMDWYSNFGDTRDIDNFALIEVNSIKRMNEVALLSLFDSPDIQIMSKKAYK